MKNWVKSFDNFFDQPKNEKNCINIFLNQVLLAGFEEHSNYGGSRTTF